MTQILGGASGVGGGGKGAGGGGNLISTILGAVGDIAGKVFGA